MKIRNWGMTAASFVIALSATAANAELLQFELNGAHRAVWTIDTTAKTDSYADGEASTYADVFGNFSELPGFDATTNYVAFIEFYTDALNGGFYIEDFYGRTDPDVERPILTTSGPSVITGPSMAPSFVLGTYQFTSVGATSPNYSLTISAVPEPANWMLMIAGFGAIGCALRRRGAAAVAIA